MLYHGPHHRGEFWVIFSMAVRCNLTNQDRGEYSLVIESRIANPLMSLCA